MCQFKLLHGSRLSRARLDFGQIRGAQVGGSVGDRGDHGGIEDVGGLKFGSMVIPLPKKASNHKKDRKV